MRDRFVQHSEAVFTRFQVPILIALTLAYAFATWYRAQRKLFWFDEVFTDYISKLPSLTQVWQALVAGTDFNPPLMYVLTRLSQSLPGQHEAVTRLPQMIGFWIFCLCLYRFVSVRAGVVAGLISMLFPCVTIAYYYAYEARPHGIVLGCCGLALVSWQSLTSNSRYRFATTLSLFVALTCALLSHSYAFLLWIPLAVGELTRTYRSRRIDFLVWGALALAGLTILVSVPLAHAQKSALGAGQFLPATPAKVINTYGHLFGPASGVMALILACLSLDLASRASSGPVNRTFRPHEWAAIAAFLGFPLVAGAFAFVTGAPVADRYSVSMVAGLACLLGALGSIRPLAGTIMVPLLMLWATVDFAYYWQHSTLTEPSSLISVSTRRAQFDERYKLMGAVKDDGSRIVLPEILDFAPTLYYAPPDLRSRLIYPLNREIYFAGFDKLRLCCGAPGASYAVEDLVKSRTEFLIYCKAAENAQVNQMRRLGALTTVEGSDGYGFLLRVTYPQNASSAGVQ